MGLSLPLLRPAEIKGKEGYEDALKLDEWLEKGAFEAFDKGYLSKVILNIHKENPKQKRESLLESYAISVDYTEGDVQIVQNGGDKSRAKKNRKRSEGVPN